MPIISDVQLGKDIRSSKIENCYFLYGRERYNVEKAVQALIHKVTKGEEDGFGIDRFDDKVTVSDINNAVCAVSLFSGDKCVVVRDFGISQCTDEEIALLLETVKASALESVLIFYYAETQPELKNAKVKKVLDRFEKHGVIACFEPKDAVTQRRQVQEICKKQKVSIDAAGADALVARFAEDGFHLRNETEKMIAFALGRSEENAVITAADVDMMCANTVENTVFDLTNAILGGNHRKVFGLLERLFEQQVEGLSITGALTLSFTDLYRARLALDSGISAKQTATDFSYPAKREFVVARSFARAERYSARQLRQCFSVLAETTSFLMGSKTDERLLIERMMARMLMIMAETKR